MAEIIPDNAIYDFLVSKGVEVEPPKSSKDIKERVIDGAITGLNPLTGAANMGLKQMGQGSKQQEWISWKQWALSHKDWGTFWEGSKEHYLNEQAEKESTELENLITKKNSKPPGPASYMRRWGIGLIAVGSINMVSFLFNPSDPSTAANLPGSVMYVIGGIWMTQKGAKNRKDLEICSEEAMLLLEQDGVVNILKLSTQLNMAEARTRLILDRAQKRNWIPYGININ